MSAQPHPSSLLEARPVHTDQTIEKQKKSKKAHKKKHKILVKDHTTSSTQLSIPGITKARSSSWHFPVDYNDHFETPLIAYEDIAPILDEILSCLHSERSRCTIYDPYYCKGNMVQHLQHLGFANIINRNQDFYRDVARKTIPSNT